MCTVKEVLFAQRLADNEKTVRDKTLKVLKKYLSVKSSRNPGITDDEALRLWKGLFYCMYMADKPLIQEALAENISGLIHHIQSTEGKLSFAQAAFLTFAREWNGIDIFRINKFMMLVRRFLRQVFTVLQECGWNLKSVTSLANVLEESVVMPRDDINMSPLDLKLHVCSIFLEELAKVGGEQLEHRVILALIQPYFKVLALSKIEVYCNGVKENIIRHLIRQSSIGQEVECFDEDMVVDNEEDGAVADDDNNMEEFEEEQDQAAEDVLDPRAGLVDVCIPELKPDYNLLAYALQTIGKAKHIGKIKRVYLNQLASELLDVTKGIYPLAPPIDDTVEDASDNEEDKINKALMRLQKFEEKVNKSEKIEDSDGDSGVDLGPTKKEVQRMRKINELKRRKLKKKAMNKQRKIVGRAEKLRMDKEQKLQALKQVEGVENVLKLVRSVSGIPTGNNKPDEKVANEVTGFNVSPVIKKKLKVKNIHTIAGFSVESLKTGKKRNCNETSVESLKTGKEGNCNESIEFPRKKKENCSFIVSNNQIAVTEYNALPEENKTTKQCPVKEESQVSKLSQSKKKSGNKISTKKITSSLDEADSKSKEINLLPECYSFDRENISEKQLQKNNKDITSQPVMKSLGTSKISKIPAKEQKGLKTLSVTDKEWEKPLKKGEYEIFIKSRKRITKEKKKGATQGRKRLLKRCGTKVRTININLKQNQTHEFSDYMKTIKASPSIPFKADLKPHAPAIKKKIQLAPAIKKMTHLAQAKKKTTEQ